MVVLRFGPFECDPATGRLYRGKDQIPLSSSQMAILRELVLRHGEIVSNEALIKAAWGNTAVNDDSLRQAIKRLREFLGDAFAAYIETARGRGFRFGGAVEYAERDGPPDPVDTWLAPHRAVVRSGADIQTLDLGLVRRARPELERCLRHNPDDVEACVELALAYGIEDQATAVDARRDRALLERAIAMARHACELKPQSCAVWSALAYVLHVWGDRQEADAALRMADSLEPDTLPETILLAYVSWGDRRLKFARRLLNLFPGLAQGHWLRATVFLARGADDLAAEEIRLGCLAQNAQPKGAPLAGIGLELLAAQWHAKHGRLEDAAAAAMREISSSEGSGHIYERECVSNAHYLLGAIRRRQGEYAAAERAFDRARAIAPGHVAATAVREGRVLSSANPIDAATGRAIVLVCQNRHAEAIAVYLDMLRQAPPGHAGWQLPIEPMLNPMAKADNWAEALTLVRARAS